MRSKYGSKAFNRDGTLKLKYLKMEKEYQMKHHPENVYRVRALTEAINFRH